VNAADNIDSVQLSFCCPEYLLYLSLTGDMQVTYTKHITKIFT